ncbi:3-hydroxyacyl-CoA dehydrogenase/enoyl-CoA hydratase family protein [Desulfofustis glycolicus]|uniref:3-hydroxyacyl-CoA dehydrogenase n=1 Tax=Desulfofustis glycolicus DSM 9705 TaxID=1121409 RepID=A0A1M5YAJ5_9BACT|nr:3-hydroxyacyl-CoA dehydrogenase/enoyl-CoA hydratase family protein [Desulfofustis glycolicus]MCB2218471.1 3-hydroxyacyl-CoA dehydrogenase/enoyl-CoA hydratase family protein [Desulfobulbaceae bacterium]SHI08986.1 3-hydroxyacyl-CoA dehydrogenase [Desulfofustis glycolicus DSM 9705]
MRQINRVAVLGAGVMGATIAAHLANAGLEVLMLDIVPRELTEQEASCGLTLDSPEVRNRIARAGLAGLARMKPAPFYLKEYGALIETGNFEDDLEKLKDCDWVIEVVVENMKIKRSLFERIAPHLGPNAVLTTNTSGLSVNEMARDLPAELRSRFLVTHFFNPPRYMRLMEIVPCTDTDGQVVAEMAEFIERRLGKGVVYAKDTANFIANRIGVYAIYKGIQHMVEMGLTVEEVDSVAGPATARPKSAAFRTADLVGLDTLAHVGTNSYDALPDDEERDVFKLPAFMDAMIKQGLLGNKSGKGFYKKEKVDGKRQISYYDYQTGDYRSLQKPKFASVQMVKQIDDPRRKIAAVVNGADQGAKYAWRSLRDTLIYTVNRIGEIADDVVNIDNAMKWGFNWELGPFEMLDAIGVSAFVKRAQKDGVAIPESLKNVDSFYRYTEDGQFEFYDVLGAGYQPVPQPAGQINLEILKRGGREVEKNGGASIIDLGDGVYCLEFHSKMNAISGDILSLVHKAIRRAEQDGVGLVIGNRGANFSVGANLMLLAVALAEGAWEDVDMVLRAFQKATMAVKYAKVPVVAAPFGMTLGGGCEFCLHADAINPSAETYMGLVEIGVGLLPGGGGTKEMCIRAVDLARRYDTDVQPFIFKHFRQIAMAQVSMGAAELAGMGYMRNGDAITMNIDRLIGDAKQKVLALAVNYRPPRPLTDIPVPGRSVAASIKSQLWNMKMGSHITEYEEKMGGIIADVICGGDVNPGTPVTEEYLLKLERENFLKLCGNKQTSERIQHMLKTGKPLRN